MELKTWSINVHLLTHIYTCVKHCGPLWVYSNFCFESNNGVLGSYVNGTTDVEKQIVSKYLLSKANQNNNSSIVTNYIEKISAKKQHVSSTKIVNITLLGSR